MDPTIATWRLGVHFHPLVISVLSISIISISLPVRAIFVRAILVRAIFIRAVVFLLEGDTQLHNVWTGLYSLTLLLSLSLLSLSRSLSFEIKQVIKRRF